MTGDQKLIEQIQYVVKLVDENQFLAAYHRLGDIVDDVESGLVAAPRRATRTGRDGARARAAAAG